MKNRRLKEEFRKLVSTCKKYKTGNMDLDIKLVEKKLTARPMLQAYRLVEVELENQRTEKEMLNKSVTDTNTKSMKDGRVHLKTADQIWKIIAPQLASLEMWLLGEFRHGARWNCGSCAITTLKIYESIVAMAGRARKSVH